MRFGGVPKCIWGYLVAEVAKQKLIKLIKGHSFTLAGGSLHFGDPDCESSSEKISPVFAVV